ncbi:MFS transporter [Spiroplasma culicicola]|uniref:Uncharacterized protein n=1 Tax=Spiroplasma culicicola AES-1 TaxID=1276246 RepID=W6A6A3_9MOLU|nr:MFS transporter [Spiroplasma culicicola]AHI52527.1 hypothetical protein SCULI_v1c01860 [Spiroplasma culicicola AES-1]
MVETNYQHQKIADITVSSLFCALIITVNLFLKNTIGFDISIYLIMITTIYFKKKISFNIMIASTILSLFFNGDVIYFGATFLSNVFIWLITIGSRILFYNFRIFQYLSIIIFSIFKYLLIYVFWSVYADNQTAIAMYIVYSLEMHVQFIAYFIFPILLASKIDDIFKGICNMNASYFNTKITNKFQEEDSQMTFSNEKRHFNTQLAVLMFSIMFMCAYLAFTPYMLAITFGDPRYSLLVLVVPIGITFFAPVWIRLKKKIGNKKAITNNWIGLTLAACFTFIPYAINSDNLHIKVMMIIGLVMFSIFIAAIMPMNMEMIRSYLRRNDIKLNFKMIMSLSSIPLLAAVFLADFYLEQKYIPAILFISIGLVTTLMLVFNKNILDKPNVLDINREGFKTLKKNKLFFANIICTNYFFGIAKFFEFTLVFLMFIDIENWKLSLDISNIGLYIACAFIIKYFAQFLARLFKITEANNVKLVYIGTALVAVAVLFVLSFFIALNFSTSISQIHYIISILATSFVVSFGATLIDKTRGEYIRHTVKENEYGAAMILDHVGGHALFSTIISLLFAVTMLFITLNITSMIVFWSICFAIIIILFMINALVIMKKQLKYSQNDDKKNIEQL